MKENIHILLFYKFLDIKNPQEVAKKHKNDCIKLGLNGRILFSEEGINGSVAGTVDKTEAYKKMMRQDERFSDIVFKEDIGISMPFRKMVVKVKKEIVTLKKKVDLKNSGKNLTPKEFLDLYEKGEDVIVLDTRNNYESKVGKFKNAITPDIEKFSDFPDFVETIKDKKDKKIVMYCTGGIRCEKASAYMKEQGFKDVSQLKGGILTFGKEFPDTVWEGTCFVFDRRLVSSVNKESKPITNCETCGALCDLCRNCSNAACDKMFVQCMDCKHKLIGCCSNECFQKHKLIKCHQEKQVISQ
ncbi:MAG TPA: rhodanese-related sulfurtransferase [Candidatus Nanoarchaeia archaeon]|nr:rhodanese-related sulfurtransferase [Candidatus Nanoarchaeia archaeon]